MLVGNLRPLKITAAFRLELLINVIDASFAAAAAYFCCCYHISIR
jgi:hypothetical protein